MGTLDPMRHFIFEKGIPADASMEEKRTIVFHRFAVMPSIPSAMLFILLGVLYGLPVLLLGSAAGLVFVSGSLLTSVAGRHLWSKVLYNYGCIVAFTLVSLSLGDAFAGYTFFLLTGIYAVFVYDKEERPWSIGGVGASILLYVGFAAAARFSVLQPLDPFVRLSAPIGTALDLFVLGFALIFAVFMNMTNEASEASLTSLRRQLEQRVRERSHEIVELTNLATAKAQFFANISHEFRTPLTLILGPIEQEIEDRGAQSPSGVRLTAVARNARRLLRLINQLLDVSRLEASAMPLTLRRVDLSALVAEIVAAFEVAAARRGLGLTLDLPGAPILGEVDVEKFEKVLLNLLSNAIKFTERGGIRVVVVPRGDRVRIDVTDTGIGIPPDDLAHVFDRFHQVDGSQSREQEGTGIGLALVKELVALQGADIDLRSELGVGTTVSVDLPLTSARTAPPEASTAGPIDGPVDRRRTELSVMEAPVGAAELVVDFPLGRAVPRILLVEDNADMRAYVRSSVGEGLQVAEAIHGVDGLALAKAHLPDLIISDVMMPKMDGYELLRELRACAATAGIPVILLTAKASEETRIEGIEAGADDYLAKPFNPRELRARIRNLLQLRDQEKKLEELNRYLTERVLKRYLPPPLVDAIVDGRMQLDQSPRLVIATILFADLVGFTTLSEDLRAVEMAARLNEFLARMIDVVFEHGGSIDKFVGDAVMVVFGAPVAMEPSEQARRAAACALAMQAAAADLASSWERQGSRGLKLRVGVHQGPVVVGNFGDSRRSDYTAIGPTVNLASRIEACAEPGAVFATGQICDFLDGAQFERAGTFDVKGIDGGVRCYRLLASPASAVAAG